MLCLSRGRGQQIRIGEDIVVTVLEVRADGVVRIGIDAPPEVPIYRAEVLEAMRKKNREDLAPPPRPQGGKDGAA